MIVQPDKVWDKVAGAVVGWRRYYDAMHRKVYGNDAPVVRPGDDDRVSRDLYDASELVLNPPPVPSARDVYGPNDARTYAAGPSLARVLNLVNTRQFRLAADMIEADCAAQFPGLKVDPATIRDVNGRVTYLTMPPAPKDPVTAPEAEDFFRTVTGRLPRSRMDVRQSVLAAAGKGYFHQANHAALILARHYGYDAADVNPFPDNTTSPWVDELPSGAPGTTGGIFAPVAAEDE